MDELVLLWVVKDIFFVSFHSNVVQKPHVMRLSYLLELDCIPIIVVSRLLRGKISILETDYLQLFFRGHGQNQPDYLQKLHEIACNQIVISIYGSNSPVGIFQPNRDDYYLQPETLGGKSQGQLCWQQLFFSNLQQPIEPVEVKCHQFKSGGIRWRHLKKKNVLLQFLFGGLIESFWNLILFEFSLIDILFHKLHDLWSSWWFANTLVEGVLFNVCFLLFGTSWQFVVFKRRMLKKGFWV